MGLNHTTDHVSVTNLPSVQLVSVSNFPSTISVSNFPSVQPVSISDAVSVSNFPSTISVSNFPALQPVSVSNFPALQPVSVSNFPALQPVSVSNFPSTISVSNAVSVSNFPSTISVSNFPALQPVSVSNFPALQPVSVSNFPALQPVSVSNFPADSRSTGNIINSATPNAAYTVNLNDGEGVTGFTVAGLTASGATLSIEGSNDGGTTWSSTNAVIASTGVVFNKLTTDQQFRVNSAGRTNLRLRVSSVGTGNITIASNASSVSSEVVVGSPLPAGNNVIGLVGLSPPFVDAFGRLRVSEPYTIFDSKQTIDNAPFFWDTFTQNGATSTYTNSIAATVLQTAAQANSIAIRQTKQCFNYQPGKSQFIYMTTYMPTEANIVKRVGYFTGSAVSPYLAPQNGIYIENNAGTVSWNIANNGVVTETVAQANWNIDPMNGTGPSGITLNINAVQIIFVNFEWLGVGTVRVGFVINDLIYYVHYFNHANSFTAVYMQTPQLTLRYTIHNTNVTASSLGLYHICGTVISEGGVEPSGITNTLTNGATPIALGAGTNQALLGIQLKPTVLNPTVFVESFNVLLTAGSQAVVQIILNPIIAGAISYTSLSSGVQGFIGAASNTVTGGTALITSFAAYNTAQTYENFENSLKLGATIAGVQDTLVLTTLRTGGADSAIGALNWREIY